jgi:hypothetical protein
MPCGAVDGENFDLAGVNSKFIQPAGSRYRAPEPCKARAKHENALHQMPEIWKNSASIRRHGLIESRVNDFPF